MWHVTLSTFRSSAVRNTGSINVRLGLFVAVGLSYCGEDHIFLRFIFFFKIILTLPLFIFMELLNFVPRALRVSLTRRVFPTIKSALPRSHFGLNHWQKRLGNQARPNHTVKYIKMALHVPRTNFQHMLKDGAKVGTLPSFSLLAEFPFKVPTRSVFGVVHTGDRSK